MSTTSTARRGLISTATRGEFRDLMTSSTVNVIATAFQDEGLAPDPDCAYTDTSVRRVTAQEHMDSVDWSDHAHVARALRVFERLLDSVDVEPQFTERFRRSLRRGGYTFSDTGEIVAVGVRLPAGSLADLRDPTAILEQLTRIQRAIIDDPALTVGSAKELIESTAKAVLLARGRPVDEKADLPVLVKEAQQALGLHPSSASPGPDGNDAVRRILGGVTTIALGLGELRNRG